jgi:hypothetical protein
MLVRYCLRQARHCDDEAALIDVAKTFAEDNLDMLGTTHPVTDAEIVNVACWAWMCEITGANMVGRGATVVFNEDVDALPQDGTILLLKLRRYHGDRRVFALANALAPSLGWGLPRLKAARECLVAAGIIECAHPGGRGPKDPPLYRWCRRPIEAAGIKEGGV